MAIVFHTKDEIIPVSSLSERWSIDDLDLIRMIVYEKFNIFFATDIRETETITYFVGHCFTYEKDYGSIGVAAQELFSGSLGAGPEAEEGEAFLLKKDVLEYEKANPYLLSKPIAPGTWQEHMQVFKDALPVSALNGGHSEAQNQGERIAELEEENQGLKKEIKSLEAALAQERDEPTGNARNTYLALLDALLFKAGIKCENVRLSDGSKNDEPGMIEKILSLAGRSLSKNTIRVKIKELQDYIEKYPRQGKRN